MESEEPGAGEEVWEADEVVDPVVSVEVAMAEADSGWLILTAAGRPV